ncbi:MAG: TatD family hydrolase [Bacteroidaceae bacterium]
MTEFLIKDIHTHLFPSEPGSALVCIGYDKSLVQAGHAFSAGLHPWQVTGEDEAALKAVEELLSLPQVIAVGECGLDRLKGPSAEIQEKVFIRQTELSEKYRKPMILHVVRAMDDLIRFMKQVKPAQKWLVHGFRGGPEQMEQLWCNGILVSFGIKFNPESLRQVPADRLLLETDGNSTIADVISAASDVRNEPAQQVEELALRNARLFF